MSIKNRLKLIMDDKRMNLKEFSEACDLPYKTLQNYILGTRKIGVEALTNIGLQMKVDINWLLTGEGSMYREKSVSPLPNLKSTAELMEGLDEEQQREVYAVVEEKKRFNRVLADLEELKQMIGKK